MRSLIPLVALVAGCTKDGDTDGGNGGFGALPDPVVTWLSEGDGEPNALPLEPMLVGARGGDRYGELRWAALVDAGRDDLGLLESRDWAAGAGAAQLRLTEDGVVVHAIDRPLDDETLPVLLVPSTVRVGLEWTSDYGDGNVNHQTVIAHTTAVTPIGPLDVWGISEDQGYGGYGKVRWYGEGVGRLGTPTTTSTFDPTTAWYEMVVPDASLPAAQLALDPAPLELLVDPFGHPAEFGFLSLAGLTGAFRDDALWLYLRNGNILGGESPGGCMRVDGSNAPMRGGADPNCPMAPVAGCYEIGYYTSTTVCETREDVMASSAEFLPGTDQQTYQYVFDEYDSTLVDLLAGYPEVIAAWAGEPMLYTWNSPAGLRCLAELGPDEFAVYDHAGACAGTTPVGRTTAITPIATYLRHDRAARPANAPPEQLPDLTLFGPTSLDDSAPFTLGAVTNDGLVFEVSFQPDGRIADFAAVGVLPGRARMYVDDTERAMYAITPDGRAFRASAAGGAVSLESLGDVSLYAIEGAARPLPVAIFPDAAVPGDYVVAIDAYDDVGFSPYFPTGLYRTHFVREPIPLVSPATLSLGVALQNGALHVCWPKTDEPFDGSDWTVAGRPAAFAFGPSEQDPYCAVIAPDEAPVDAMYIGAERALAGTVPGAGHVRIGIPPQRADGPSLYRQAVMLRDGTAFEENGWHLDERGVPFERMNGVPGFLSTTVADLGGYGVWHGTENLGGGLATVPCELPCQVVGFAIGGGLLLNNGEIHRPDGTVDVAPDPQWLRARSYGGARVLADGRICGFGSPISCTDTAGVETSTAGVASVSTDGYSYGRALWPLSDGKFVVQAQLGNATLLFDPVAMTLSELDARTIRWPMTAHDGEVFALVEDYTVPPLGTVQVARVTSAGLETLTPPVASVVGNGAQGWTVLPFADHLMVRAVSGTDGAGLPIPDWFRLERP